MNYQHDYPLILEPFRKTNELFIFDLHHERMKIYKSKFMSTATLYIKTVYGWHYFT